MQSPGGFCTRQVADMPGERAFPNIYKLVTAAKSAVNAGNAFVPNTSRPSRYASTIDVLQLYDGKRQLGTIHDLNASNLATKLDPGASACIFIVERVDEEFMDFLVTRYPNSSEKQLAQFLEEYLDSPPWYNFHGIDRHVPRLSSRTCRDSQYVNIEVVGAREFTRPVRLEDDRVRSKTGSWWDIYDRRAGGIEPIQRRRKEGNSTDFSPVALVRHHFAAWFDIDAQGAWKTGVVLVDPPFDVDDRHPPLQNQTTKPLLKFARDVLARNTHQNFSYRSLITAMCEQNEDLLITTGVPQPLIVLRSMFDIIVSEWVCATTYFIRDLNSIEWILENRNGNRWQTPDDLEHALRSLFTIRRRIAKYKSLVKEQVATCNLLALKSPWSLLPPQPAGNQASQRLDNVSEAIQMDLGQALELISQTIERNDQGVQLLTSLLAIMESQLSLKEAERTMSQNKILLILTSVATFCLPISTAASVLNMQGDWAPSNKEWANFWKICIPISCVSVLVVILLRFYKDISRILYRGFARMTPPEKVTVSQLSLP
ncbi:hypothetical protein B0T26DRAFT_733418 [Lasiosphaeria miniovina]|uniref:Uncharacterized protein n=1 Tax=Lasiosphaeria miniovina TaxID=1954250 RepID=A0AA40DKB2_9PEZI|nr:uncharacterized protein B0T26DRAFT_733418 [Lasiosphaeria miniovina]KAK0703957.1 hypothetical protein B0T26DRAFT_733418 [Lasiosphaeria miniovina]